MLALEGLFVTFVLFVGTGAIFPLLRRMGGEGTVSVHAGGPEGAIYMAAFAVTGLLLYQHWRTVFALIREEPVLWALPALALVSAAWSTDRGQSVRSGIALAGGMAFGTYVAIRFGVRGQLRVLAGVLVLALALSIAAALTDPYIGVDRGAHAGAWRGVFSHKNLFGRVCALATTVFVLFALYRPRVRVFAAVLAGVSVILVWLSQSRTSLVVVGATLAFVGLRPLLRRLRVRHWAIALGILAVVALLAGLAWSQRTSLIQRDPDGETLTGRTVLWAASLLKFADHPWLGYGYDAFWNGGAGNYFDIWKFVGWPAPNSHDAFLDVALDLGLVGVGLFVLCITRVLHRALALFHDRSLDALEQAWPSTFVVFVVVAFLTEGQLMMNHAYWMLFTCAAVSSIRTGEGTAPKARHSSPAPHFASEFEELRTP